MIVEIERGNGMKELKVKRNRWWRRNKAGVLYGCLMAPPFIGLLFIDGFAKHPKAALAYLVGVGAWYLAFLVANTRKMPRRAGRGVKSSSGKHSFATYYITRDGGISREEAAS